MAYNDNVEMQYPYYTQEVVVMEEGQDVKTASMIVIDMGKKKRKDVRRLRKGRGRLMRRLNEAIGDLQQEGVISESSQPIVVVVREKGRRRG